MLGSITSSGKRRGAALAAALLLSGCATWSRHGIKLEPPVGIRIAVLPVRSAFRVKRLKDIRTSPESGSEAKPERELVAEEMSKVTQRLSLSLQERMKASYFFEAVPSRQVLEGIEASGIRLTQEPMTSAEARRLGKELDAELVLDCRISGYGKIKKKWLAFLIGTGAVEGAVQGAVAAQIADNKWVGVGVGLQEFLREILTWGGGAIIFNKFLTPVILEGRALSLADGEAVWSHTAFAVRNGRLLKAMPKEDRKRREVRLRLAAQGAVLHLVDHLEKRAWRNIEKLDRLDKRFRSGS